MTINSEGSGKESQGFPEEEPGELSPEMHRQGFLEDLRQLAKEHPELDIEAIEEGSTVYSDPASENDDFAGLVLGLLLQAGIDPNTEPVISRWLEDPDRPY